MTRFKTTSPEVSRDRWGRPLVLPPGGGPAVAYTRCTTYVGVVEDTYTLGLWQQRMVAIGLADRPDLLLAVTAHRDDKEKLNAICADASEAAKAHAAATTGTALHALTEQVDRGAYVNQVLPTGHPYRGDLEAYVEATRDLTATHIEQFCVLDSYKIGGTPDRVVSYQGKRYIADLKTGVIDYGYVKIAAQLAVYSRSRCYDPPTGERTTHGAETDRGIIIHAPAGTGTCTLYWVDLLAGWEAVNVARRVREQRALKFPDLVTGWSSPVTRSGVTPRDPTLAEQILLCRTADEVRALWAKHAEEWTPDLTEQAKHHIASLNTTEREGVTA